MFPINVTHPKNNSTFIISTSPRNNDKELALARQINKYIQDFDQHEVALEGITSILEKDKEINLALIIPFQDEEGFKILALCHGNAGILLQERRRGNIQCVCLGIKNLQASYKIIDINNPNLEIGLYINSKDCMTKLFEQKNEKPIHLNEILARIIDTTDNNNSSTVRTMTQFGFKNQEKKIISPESLVEDTPSSSNKLFLLGSIGLTSGLILIAFASLVKLSATTATQLVAAGAVLACLVTNAPIVMGVGVAISLFSLGACYFSKNKNCNTGNVEDEDTYREVIPPAIT